jgi:predicted aspartyl protease
MPHLTWPVQVQGPIVNLWVTISTARAGTLRKAGHRVPAGISLPALVDTGATSTVIDEATVQSLGLVETGFTQMHTTSTGSTAVTCYQYDAYLAILDVQNFYIGDTPITAANLSNHAIRALIGRDVLSKCLLVYDGTLQQFTLAF